MAVAVSHGLQFHTELKGEEAVELSGIVSQQEWESKEQEKRV